MTMHGSRPPYLSLSLSLRAKSCKGSTNTARPALRPLNLHADMRGSYGSYGEDQPACPPMPAVEGPLAGAAHPLAPHGRLWLRGAGQPAREKEARHPPGRGRAGEGAGDPGRAGPPEQTDRATREPEPHRTQDRPRPPQAKAGEAAASTATAPRQHQHQPPRGKATARRQGPTAREGGEEETAPRRKELSAQQRSTASPQCHGAAGY